MALPKGRSVVAAGLAAITGAGVALGFTVLDSTMSYVTLRDHAFTVTGGSVTYVRRLEPGKNVRWEITVTPGSSADVAIALNATTDCSAQGAICTQDDRKLSGGLELTVNGL